MKITIAGKTLPQALPYILSVGGLVGFIASFVLTVEKIALIKDPSFEPSCNLNPILSCGSVMVTPQAEIFGFPNSLIGIAGFALITCIGMALLAGAQFKRWFWRGLQAGVIFGISFVFWLQFQSIFTIGALCPYCMVVWSVMIPIFWYTTLYNIRAGHIPVHGKLTIATNFLQRHHGVVLLYWYFIIVAIITHRFWYYWSTMFQ